jgi:hypothetical protein
MPACAGGGAEGSDGAQRRWNGPGGMTGFWHGGIFRQWRSLGGKTGCSRITGSCAYAARSGYHRQAIFGDQG